MKVKTGRHSFEWRPVYSEQDNYVRLRKFSFEPVKAYGLRLVVESTWGAPEAHVFAFDAL